MRQTTVYLKGYLYLYICYKVLYFFLIFLTSCCITLIAEQAEGTWEPNVKILHINKIYAINIIYINFFFTDVYIPLTRIDAGEIPVNNVDNQMETNEADDSTEDLALDGEATRFFYVFLISVMKLVLASDIAPIAKTKA